MGRGDIKTKKGKIKAGSFGKSRPAKQVIKAAAPKAATAKPATAKAAAKTGAPKEAAEKKTPAKKAK